MDILVKNMELTQLMDIFNEAGVRYYKNGEPIEFEIFHNDEDAMKPLYERFIAAKSRGDDGMEDREISELTYDLLELIHEYDWYACADTGKEDYLKAKKAFKKKWFGTNRGLRIKRIVDDAVEHTREELYETFDLKEQEHEK